MGLEVPNARPKLQASSFARELLETAILIALVFTLVNLATVRFYIEGPSMEPNFAAKQFLIVSRVHYLLGAPERGDIIVFDAPQDDDRPDDPLLIKRVIGLPGDRVEIRDGLVYVNDAPLEEPYLNEPGQTTARANHAWELGADEYFMMGDNRGDSRDSREFGPVERARIVGEAIVRYWPPTDWGLVTRYRFPVGQS